MVDFLDLALWDSTQVVADGSFRGRTMLGVFTSLPRLRRGGLSERIINHLRGWPYFVRPDSD